MFLSLSGQKELVLKSDKLSLVVLYNPTLAGLKHFSKQYLAVKSCYRQLIYSGPALSECGSWLLQDGVLQFGDLARILKDLEMPDFEPFYVNSFGVGKWTQDNIEKLTSFCIKLNPEVSQSSADAGNKKLFNVLSSFFEEKVFIPDRFDEKEKFSVSCFRSPNQNCSLIRIGDFKMFINADSTKLPLDIYNGSDLILLTASDVRSIKWLQTSFESSDKFHFGMLYSNAISSASQKASEEAEPADKGLLLNVSDALKMLTRSLNNANIPVQSCFSFNNLQPTTIYHKAGFGTLQLYPLTPSADSKEVKELQKSQNNENILSGFPPSSCVLLWQPFNKKQPPIRLFFSGFVPQQSLFEGLVKMKNVQCFSTWDGLSPVESMNKLNKLKSKNVPERTATGLTNGNAQKLKDSARASAAKQKATDSSSATSHSAHGDGVTPTTKVHSKPKTTTTNKSEVPSVAKQEKVERGKLANTSVLSTPGKTEPTKQPVKTRHSMGPLPAKTALKATKDVATKPSTASTTGHAKPSIAGTNATVKQALQSKPPAPKSAKEIKPPVKAVATNKAKLPKPTATQPKKEASPEKAKLEASPKLEKKGKPQKAGEKKDAEKLEKKVKKEEKLDPRAIEACLIEEHITNKEEAVNLVSPVKENSPDELKEEQLLDAKLEVSALTSSSEDKSDQLVSSKEQEELEVAAPVDTKDKERDVDKPEVEGEHLDIKEEVIIPHPGSEVQSSICTEDEQPVECIEEGPMDDLDEDSLGNEAEKDHSELKTEEVVESTRDAGEEEEEDEMEADETQPAAEQDHGTIPEPARHVVDEMVRSGISLAESAGTESAPNENLYSQDLDEESPVEEEDADVCLMEKTLIQSKVLEEEHKLESKSDLVSPLEHDSTEAEAEEECIEKDVIEECIEKDVAEECIEKDVIEELEKTIEPKEADALKDEKHEDVVEEIQDEVIKHEVASLVEGAKKDIADSSLVESSKTDSEHVIESQNLPKDDDEDDHQVRIGESLAEDETSEVSLEEDDQAVVAEEQFESSEPVHKEPLSSGDDLSQEEVESKLNGHHEESTEVEEIVEETGVEDNEIDYSEVDVPAVEPSDFKEPSVHEENVDDFSCGTGISKSHESDAEIVHDEDSEELIGVTEPERQHVISNLEDVEKSETANDKEGNLEINLDYFSQEDDVENKGCIQGIGDVDLRKHLEEEKSPLGDDQVFPIQDEETDDRANQLIDFECSATPVGTSLLKKDSGIDDLAAICCGNPSTSSDNVCSESADSTLAVAGSISEPQQLSDDDKLMEKGDFNQFCGEIADHLSIIKEHRDAMQKELSATDKDVVFYNKNVGFHKEHVDELSEEDQDELETISEHPEIEEEEELLMNKTDVSLDQSTTQAESVKAGASESKQLIDLDEFLSKNVAQTLSDPLQLLSGNGVSADQDSSKVDPFGKLGEHVVST